VAEETTFKVDIADHVGTVTLSRAKFANSLPGEFWEKFPLAINALGGSSSVRTIVLAAEGKHFCSGIDTSFLSKIVTPPPAEAGRQRAHVFFVGQRLQAAIGCVSKVRVPVIAAVQGACLGAGLDLVSACDLRYCSADAFFAVQEIQVGVADDLGALQRLPRLIPDGIAREMAFTGRKLTADHAKTIGFVSEVFESVEVMRTAVAEVAREIAAKSPLAIWGSKQMLNYNDGHTVEDSLLHAIMCGAAIFQPDDVLSSLEAHKSHRVPVYDDLVSAPPSLSDIA
jgi:enoyl-CoA hydratase